MSGAKPTPTAFGQWLACADGRAHYALGVPFLCGATPLTTGVPVYDAKAGRIAVPHCTKCLRLNTARWGKKGA